MNKTFKVIWSKARRALMVVNEATSSIQAKGTKTVVAAAVAAVVGALTIGASTEAQAKMWYEDTTLTDIGSYTTNDSGETVFTTQTYASDDHGLRMAESEGHSGSISYPINSGSTTIEEFWLNTWLDDSDDGFTSTTNLDIASDPPWSRDGHQICR